MTIFKQVCALIATQAQCDPAGLGPATRLEELGLDSLGMVETIFALEESFNIAIPFNANLAEEGGLHLSACVADVVGLVEHLMGARAA